MEREKEGGSEGGRDGEREGGRDGGSGREDCKRLTLKNARSAPPNNAKHFH